eukprot:Pompholyxophrys_punicea_v1_NODE_1727_length_578_cov_17.170172.p1 type:complete len:168 gc:universal NODE_1727_length_578_cov_17.170172:39-542(+)
MIQRKSARPNPFDKYNHFCGKGEPKPVRLKIWLPFSESKARPMELVVKRDATVEDVIGYALYEYTDEGRLPDALPQMAAYSLRIAEDDGIIDDDFPALDRVRHIQKFSFDSFVLCEVNRASRPVPWDELCFLKMAARFLIEQVWARPFHKSDCICQKDLDVLIFFVS